MDVQEDGWAGCRLDLLLPAAGEAGGCVIHSGLHIQQIRGCHGSAQQMWECRDEAGLHQTTVRMRRKQRSAPHQELLDGAKTALGITMHSCPKRGGRVHLVRELSPDLLLDKREVLHLVQPSAWSCPS